MRACDACTRCVKDRKLPTAGRVEVGGIRLEVTESLVPSVDSVGIGTSAVVVPSLKEVDTVKYELPYICDKKLKVLPTIDVAISDDGEIFTESIASTEKFPISPEKNQSNVETDYGVITIVAMRSPIKKKQHCEKDESIVSDVALSRVVGSDTGVNRCAFTVPVIHCTSLGDDEHDKKLLALGVFSSKDATADSATEFVDGSEIRTTESQESSQKIIETTSLKLGMILHLESSPVTEDFGASRCSRNSRSTPPTISPSSHYSAGSGYDKKRLTERLKQRLAQRNQNAAVDPPTKSEEVAILSCKTKKELATDSSNGERKIHASRQKCRTAPRLKSKSNDDANSDIFSRYSRTSELDSRRVDYPDSVTFSGTDDEESTLRGNSKARLCYRKCVSEVGFTGSLSTRLARSKLSKHHHSHHHRIGILQADGIVYDDALLLRLARQARHGRMRGEVINSVADDIMGSTTGERRHNEVKIHIYDLLTNDSFVEVPYLNCSFPIGQCFKVVNDGCHVLGTGAYHVGVEVNGIEYAFGANNIIGMSGIFTCTPKESPGYEFRETLDFGKLHTSKRTWILISKSGKVDSYKTISVTLGGSFDSGEKVLDEMSTQTKAVKHFYSFREIESFADGHAIIHSMAGEYMGTDYDLLRRNCCTFARDACTRLGVKEEDIPRWFHNAAQAGADAEDVINNVENSVRNMLDCADGGDPLDMECYNHGFEVIIDEKDVTSHKVLESPAMRTPHLRGPLSNDLNLNDSIHETASWTY